MNKLHYILFTILISLLFSITVNGQERRMETAQKLVDNYAYRDAIKVYEKLVKKGYRSPALFEKLGDAYYFKNEPDNAIKWYRELFYLKKEVQPIYYYRMAMALKSLGRYEKANEMLDEYSKRDGGDLRAELYEKNKNYVDVIKNNSGRYKIKITDASSTVSDYGPAFYGDMIVFSSNRDSIGLSNKKDKWTNRSFNILYMAQVGVKGTLNKVEKFPTGVDAKFHVSTPAFTKDKTVMYFTSNNYNTGEMQRDDKNRVLLKIYRAVLDGKKLKDVEELPFCSNSYNVAHPALSPDEKTLYFASDMSGTYGESDIYKVSINEDGTFGTPENLGPGINTEGKETFPFVTGDKLYFASNGHPGLGGLDVFVSKEDSNGLFSKVINVGEPVNGRWDDFALIINEQTKMGYFSSNRKSGRGYDDIYSLLETTELNFGCAQRLSGVVADEKTGDISANAKVILFDQNHTMLKETTTDEAGLYSFDVKCGKSYYVRSESESYVPKEVSVFIQDGSGETNLPITQVKS